MNGGDYSRTPFAGSNLATKPEINRRTNDMTDKDIILHDTTDARVWAAEFCKRWPSALCQIEGKEGVSDGADFEHIMVGWFANAIMAGVDSEARKHSST